MKKLKNKKIISEQIIINLLFFILFLFFPLLKASAAPDILLDMKSTGPSNNSLTTDQSVPISVSFTYPLTLSGVPTAPNLNYNVLIRVSCDGVLRPINDKYIVSNKPKNTMVPGSTGGSSITYLGGVCPISAQTMSWNLYATNDTGTILSKYTDLNSSPSFTFKINENYQGYYYIYKKRAGDQFIFSRSSTISDEQTCLTESANYINQNPGATIYKACQFYNSIPDLTGPEYYNIDAINTPPESGGYELLAPIGGLTVAPDNIGEYFNTIFLIVIGLCGVLAVVMIVVGGVQYMGSESIFEKSAGKQRITSAILGLLIALGSFAILNTINPDLLGKNGLNIKKVSAVIVDLPDVGDNTIDADFINKIQGSYNTGTPSLGVTSAVNKLQQGWSISRFVVNSNINKMTINLANGNQVDNTSVVDILPGGNGYAPTGQGVVGDRKTPRGTWSILSIKTPGNGIPIFNKTGSNMGPSFWLLNPTTNGERGIGIHGNKTGTLTATAGCIRLKNADILALLPYVKSGIPVIVN